ncbi:hypothetical protein TI39_contig52g00004 [Zymoseptoria brevis]|uniref:Uncharacterized protein n=1 Tax=Zymoseptoria brevis TaxID=1047168 RepID=A0A0F4GZJ4_9PEZI|nr:hypothetical protein TI39_contig52g00004 [Zymoseptoria brevis]
MTRKLRAARDSLAMYSDWQVVRMVSDEGMIPAAKNGDAKLLAQYLKALKVMVAGHKADVLIANKRGNDRVNPTKEVKAFMGMDHATTDSRFRMTGCVAQLRFQTCVFAPRAGRGNTTAAKRVVSYLTSQMSKACEYLTATCAR